MPESRSINFVMASKHSYKIEIEKQSSNRCNLCKLKFHRQLGIKSFGRRFWSHLWDVFNVILETFLKPCWKHFYVVWKTFFQSVSRDENWQNIFYSFCFSTDLLRLMTSNVDATINFLTACLYIILLNHNSNLNLLSQVKVLGRFIKNCHFSHLCRIRGSSNLVSKPPWTSGYRRRLMLWRSWVRMTSPYTGWTCFHIHLL